MEGVTLQVPVIFGRSRSTTFKVQGSHDARAEGEGGADKTMALVQVICLIVGKYLLGVEATILLHIVSLIEIHLYMDSVACLAPSDGMILRVPVIRVFHPFEGIETPTPFTFL